MMVYNGDIIKKRTADIKAIHRYIESRLGSSGAGATPATTRGEQLSGGGGGGGAGGRKGTTRRRRIRDSHVRDADAKVGK